MKGEEDLAGRSCVLDHSGASYLSPRRTGNAGTLRGKHSVHLRIRFRATDGAARLPIHYNEYIQAFIYRHLDEHLATVLHDQGIPEGKRRLKLFTFSRLLGPCRVGGEYITFSGPITLVVASPMVRFLESFALHLVTAGTLRLGSVSFYLEAAEVGFQPEYRSSILVRALSPITVYSTLQKPEGGKKTYYYSPFEKEFETLLLQNLQRKVRAWYGQEVPAEGASVKPFRVTNQNHHVVLYKGTVIKGWTGIYELRLPEPYFHMALDAGLGAKNSQGFGCIEVWEPQRDQ